jgi:hypothetical protein
LHILDNLVPRNLISSIPCFKSQNHDLSGLDYDFIKNKLLVSEENNNIIKLSRGEGRRDILNSIINLPNIIFDWGEKAMHSLVESSEARDFLEPNIVTKELLNSLLDLYKEELEYHNNKYLNKYGNKTDKETVIQKISEAIVKHDSYNDLLLIKEWLCFALHTSGNKKFSEISPWVSTCMGNSRYKIAYLYGTGNQRYLKLAGKHMAINKSFVILDYWVPVCEENTSFRNADYIGNKLRSMGVPWYPNKHNEVMVKYALFPHQLIGYYYFDNDELQYYYVNHHYLEEWAKNSDFKIGDYLYIDQTNVDFPSNNPYKIIYTKQGKAFSVFKRR